MSDWWQTIATRGGPVVASGERYKLIWGDSQSIPLASASVHSIATSPPYYGLRDYGLPPTIWPRVRYYQMAGDLLPVECPEMTVCLGLEPTVQQYVAHMVHLAREFHRVLRDDGTFWLNVGDSYGGGTRKDRAVDAKLGERAMRQRPQGSPKNLLMVPDRVALALQADGWILRSKIPWLKANSMPESVRDRPAVSHETIMVFAKGERYFWDIDAIRRPSAASTLVRDRYTRITDGKDGEYAVQHDHETPSHEGGRNRRTGDWFAESVAVALAELQEYDGGGAMLLDVDGDPQAIAVNPRPYKGAHYAVWPMPLVSPMVRASTSEKGCCPTCGGPWERVVEREASDPARESYHGQGQGGIDRHRCGVERPGGFYPEAPRTMGWGPSCQCLPHEPVPCVVLDPFNGSGATGEVSLLLGRRYVGMDLSKTYLLDHAVERCERGSRPHKADALAVPRRRKPLANQSSFLD